MFARCVGRSLLVAASAAFAIGQPSTASAQASRGPIKLVVPFPVGATIDVLTRYIASKLPAVLGQPVIVENKAGASGNIGTEFVVNALPDGTTFLVTVHSALTINPLIYSKLKHNPEKDLVPIANLFTGGYLLAARPNLPYRTVNDVVAAARANPGGISYASFGYGSMAHICMEMLQTATSIKLRHVPYRATFTSDLIAGHVDIAFENVGAGIPQVQQQKIQAIALSHKPIAQLPGVPAVSDTVPGFDCVAWVGVFAPKGVSASIQQRMSDEITKIVATQAFAELSVTMGGTASPMGRDIFGPFVQADFAKWRKVVPPLNIKLD